MKYEFTSKGGDLFVEIKHNFPTINYNQVKTALRKKDIKINGTRLSASVTLNPNDFVEIYLPNKEKKQIKIIYEDDNVLIVHKPQGMETTVKDKSYADSECLEEYFENSKAVHRLDKNTEGVVVMAKNKTAEKELIEIFKQKKLEKFYIALVWGEPKFSSKLLTNFGNKKDGKMLILKKETTDCLTMKTAYDVIKTNHKISLLSINLLTGVMHQIRCQLSNIGNFILGDDKYGVKKINKQLKVKKQCLCANKIKFKIDETSFLNYLNNVKIETSATFNTNIDDYAI